MTSKVNNSVQILFVIAHNIKFVKKNNIWIKNMIEIH